jgi:hypothetical protein
VWVKVGEKEREEKEEEEEEHRSIEIVKIMAIPEAFKMSMQKTVQIKDLEIERVKPILWNKLIQKPQGT